MQNCSKRSNDVVELRENSKPLLENVEVVSKSVRGDYSRHHFKGVFATKITFEDVVFNQCVFEACYIRNCTFINCNFKGSVFKDTYLHGTNFRNCGFWYVRFDKCQIDSGLIDQCLPKEENIARELVRSLRVNYAQIGSYEGVNKAAAYEVCLTGRHYFKAIIQNSEYYTLEKYQGWSRFLYAARYCSWKLMDVLWGNGESLWKVIRSAGVTVIVGSLLWHLLEPGGASILLQRTGTIAALFFATPSPNGLAVPFWLGVSISIARIILTALFLAVLVKRLARR